MKLTRILITLLVGTIIFSAVGCGSSSGLKPTPTPTAGGSTNILWFGTTDGMSEYDGIHWTTYNTSNSGLAGEWIIAIAIDNAGNKWFSTFTSQGELVSFKGVTKYDGTHWTTYNTSNSGLASNRIRVIAVDSNDNKWFGTKGDGISKYDGIHWTTYNISNSGLANNNVTAVAIDSDGHKWFGTMGGGVNEYDGTNWITYNTSNSGLSGNGIFAIAIDSDGNKWFATWTSSESNSVSFNGVSRYDGASWITFNTNNSGLANNMVEAIAIDNTGNKWFGTCSGVSKYDGANWTTYTPNNSGLASNCVQAITIDDTGNKWFGTNFGGVSKYDGTHWITYNTSNSGLVDGFILTIAIENAGSK